MRRVAIKHLIDVEKAKDKRTSRPDFDYVVGGLTLLICGLLMLGGIYAVSRPQQNLIEIAQTAEGTVLELSPVNAQKRFYDATIQFVASNNHIYMHRERLSNGAQYKPGDKIELLYDPTNPQRVILRENLIKGDLTYLCLTMAGLLFTGLGLYCCLKAFQPPTINSSDFDAQR